MLKPLRVKRFQSDEILDISQKYELCYNPKKDAQKRIGMRIERNGYMEYSTEYTNRSTASIPTDWDILVVSISIDRMDQDKDKLNKSNDDYIDNIFVEFDKDDLVDNLEITSDMITSLATTKYCFTSDTIKQTNTKMFASFLRNDSKLYLSNHLLANKTDINLLIIEYIINRSVCSLMNQYDKEFIRHNQVIAREINLFPKYLKRKNSAYLMDFVTFISETFNIPHIHQMGTIENMLGNNLELIKNIYTSYLINFNKNNKFVLLHDGSMVLKKQLNVYVFYTKNISIDNKDNMTIQIGCDRVVDYRKNNTIMIEYENIPIRDVVAKNFTINPKENSVHSIARMAGYHTFLTKLIVNEVMTAVHGKTYYKRFIITDELIQYAITHDFSHAREHQYVLSYYKKLLDSSKIDELADNPLYLPKIFIDYIKNPSNNVALIDTFCDPNQYNQFDKYAMIYHETKTILMTDIFFIEGTTVGPIIPSQQKLFEIFTQNYNKFVTNLEIISNYDIIVYLKIYDKVVKLGSGKNIFFDVLLTDIIENLSVSFVETDIFNFNEIPYIKMKYDFVDCLSSNQRNKNYKMIFNSYVDQNRTSFIYYKSSSFDRIIITCTEFTNKVQYDEIVDTIIKIENGK